MDESYAIYVGLVLVNGKQREIINDNENELWCESCWEKSNSEITEEMIYERIQNPSESGSV